MNNVEQLFKHPKDEISKMESDYQKTFGSHLANFIKSEARILSSRYHDKCAHILVDRFTKINEVVKKLPSNPSKKQYDIFVQTVLSLAKPSEISNEMALVINNDDVYTYYEGFIMRSKADTFHNLYMKCSFSKDSVLVLNQLAMVQIKDSIDQLNNYINSLKSHNKLIKKIKEKRKGDAVLKTGASIIGMGLGIPFLGMGLGALLGSGDKQKIKESLGDIFNNIEFLEESLYKTIDKLGESLYLLFLTLIGGTFVAVNNALITENICIEKMNADDIVIYSLTPNEKQKFENWFHVSIKGITTLVKEKQWHQAMRVVKEMHQIIASKPIHSHYEISPGKSALYIAHVYYYAVYQEALLVEYLAGHKESFVKQSKAFLDTLILYPLEKDFPAFASNPAIFLFLYVKQCITYNDKQTYWLEKADSYISKRQKKVNFMGEHGDNPKDYAQNMIPFFIIGQFYNHINKQGSFKVKYKHDELMYQAMSQEKIDQFITIDQSLNQLDQFSEFLQILSSRKKKKKLSLSTRWSKFLTIAIVVSALLMLFVNTSDTWSSIFQNDEQIENTQPLGSIRIVKPVVNIRETPSLEGTVIATGYVNETYSYLKGENIDRDGVTWLKIKLADGEIAYVSKSVVSIQTLKSIRIVKPVINIRETPSLDGTVIATGYADETYSFLKEESIDKDGVTWLKIKLADGKVAYVSKGVVLIE